MCLEMANIAFAGLEKNYIKNVVQTELRNKREHLLNIFLKK